jgi:hypothetical protein
MNLDEVVATGRHLMHVVHWRHLAGWLAIPLLATASIANAEPHRPLFDTGRLRIGTFLYRNTVDGQSPTFSTITVSGLPDGTYRFAADFPGFDQSWNTIATRALAPVTTQLKMRTHLGRHYMLTLKYSGLEVSGEAITAAARDRSHRGSDRPVKGHITSRTVDQRIDWAAAMCTDMRPGDSFEFEVYDANTALSRVHAEVSDAGTMDTAEGKVHAVRISYTVYKSTGTEAYTVYTTATFPRVMLRENLPGKLVSTLVRIRP